MGLFLGSDGENSVASICRKIYAPDLWIISASDIPFRQTVRHIAWSIADVGTQLGSAVSGVKSCHAVNRYGMRNRSTTENIDILMRIVHLVEYGTNS